MNPLITDEIVEKAARAIVRSIEGCRNPPDDCNACALLASAYMSNARAALDAALPEIVEACAKAIDDLPHMFDAPSGIMDAQNAIRLLKGDGK